MQVGRVGDVALPVDRIAAACTEKKHRRKWLELLKIKTYVSSMDRYPCGPGSVPAMHLRVIFVIQCFHLFRFDGFGSDPSCFVHAGYQCGSCAAKTTQTVKI